MNNIDKKLFDHIYCEYKWGLSPIPGESEDNRYLEEQRVKLFEGQGQVPDIDKYVEGFKNFVKEKILPFIKDGGTYSDKIKSPAVFGVESPFFNICNIDIIASLRDGTISWKGGYDPYKSTFGEYGGYIVMRITAGAPKENYLLSTLATTFAHELTHAYDDYKAYLAGNDSMAKLFKNSGYEDKVLTWNLYRGFESDLGRLLYLLSPIERNAIIGQISTEIADKELDTPQQALGAIKRTKAYGNYLEIRNLVGEFNAIEDDSTKIIILSAYKNIKENVSKNITYEAFLRDINAQFKKWEKKFLNTAGKIAYTQYWKKEACKWGNWGPQESQAPLKNNINEGFERERTSFFEVPSMKIIDLDET